MSNTRRSDDGATSEFVAIKKLLILMLLRDGATQAEIAAALGVDRSAVSRMFPGGSGKLTKASNLQK